MCVLSIKLPIRKKSGNLFNDPRITSLNSGFFLLNRLLYRDCRAQFALLFIQNWKENSWMHILGNVCIQLFPFTYMKCDLYRIGFELGSPTLLLYFDLRPGPKMLFQGDPPEGSDTF